jgi:hypothetical protein
MKKYFFLKVPWHRIAGIGSIMIFIVLIAIRLNLLQYFNIDKPEAEQSAIITLPAHESWMDITQKGRKIGYAHRRFIDTDSGFNLSEAVFMRINTMGIIQDIRFNTEGNLNRNLQLEAFNFNLHSSLFSFRLRGLVDGRQLTLFTGESGSEKRHDMTLAEAPIYPAVSSKRPPRRGCCPVKAESFTYSIRRPWVSGPSRSQPWAIKRL